MAETLTTLQRAAAEARAHFGTDNPRKVWSYESATTPQWVQDLVYAAHGNGSMFPDDWRYAQIVYALDSYAENANPDNIEPEPDIYTADIVAWVGSRADRLGYCDDAAAEYGTSADASMFDRLQLGQYAEMREVWDSVRASLDARADEIESESETDDSEGAE